MNPMVVIPYAPGGLRIEVVHAVQMQWPAAQFVSLPGDDEHAYADLLRLCWQLPGDLVVLEHDVLPPHRSIEGLLSCTRAWCTHLHWICDRYQPDTLGLACFRWAFRQLHLELAEQALASPDRRGPHPCYAPDAAPPVDGRGRILHPSNVSWRTCDSELARLLYHAGLKPHVHEPPTVHLHDYSDAVQLGQPSRASR